MNDVQSFDFRTNLNLLQSSVLGGPDARQQLGHGDGSTNFEIYALCSKTA